MREVDDDISKQVAIGVFYVAVSLNGGPEFPAWTTSPVYVAVMRYAPATVGVYITEQLALAPDPERVQVPPGLMSVPLAAKVTVPLGVTNAPGEVSVTIAMQVVAVPCAIGDTQLTLTLLLRYAIVAFWPNR